MVEDENDDDDNEVVVVVVVGMPLEEDAEEDKGVAAEEPVARP